MRKQALLFINGKKHEIGGTQAFWMLSDYLRYELRMTGTKVVCAEGDCGACSVLRAFPAPGSRAKRSRMSFLPVNSCIALVAQLDGSHLITVEGIQKDGELSEIQKSMVAQQGSQCGYCTPGFVVALAGLLDSTSASGKEITEKRVRNALTGNLCRCTGYKPIVDAALAADTSAWEPIRERYASKSIENELIRALKEPLKIEAEGKVFYAPVKLSEAALFRARSSDSKLVSASTDLGVQVNKGKISPHSWLSLHLIPELYSLEKKKGEIHVGARVTLSSLREFVEPVFPEFADYLNVFASPQIKNAATLAGNVANASPIGDTIPFLLGMDAEIEIQGPRGRRREPISKFYTGYRQTTLKRGEFIVRIRFALPVKGEIVRLFKVSQRKDLDISCVNSCFRVTIQKGHIQSARIAFGGVGPTALRLLKSERYLIGKKPSRELLEDAVKCIRSEVTPLSDVRGSAEYRKLLCENLFRKFSMESLGIEP